MQTKKRPEVHPAYPKPALLGAVLALLAASLACLGISSPGGQQGAAEHSDAQSCDARGEVAITLGEFSEETTIESDGSPSGVECTYAYQVENTGSGPVILVYYDHYYYGDNPPPNDYEFGWNRTAPIQPGESWTLRSFLTSYPKQPLYLDMISDLAVISGSPACAWLVTNGIDPEILKIETAEPLGSPCQLVSPDSDPGAAPDLMLGLRTE